MTITLAMIKDLCFYLDVVIGIGWTVILALSVSWKVYRYFYGAYELGRAIRLGSQQIKKTEPEGREML